MRMRNSTALPSRSASVLLAAALVAGTANARPRWVDRLDEPRPKWDTWENSLEPRGATAHPVAFAVQGKTGYVIVIPEAATPMEKKAAEELQSWLGQMTGAEFPIVADTEPAQPRELSVGRTRRLAHADLPRGSEELAEDGYAITVQGERVYLLGGKRTGPLYAVIALLEEDLGCRWYAPDAKRVPRRPTLRVGVVARTFIPSIRIRDLCLWNSRSHGRTEWAPWNRINGYKSWLLSRTRWGDRSVIPKWGGAHEYRGWAHTFLGWVPPDKYFEQHPEYYALSAGKRHKGSLCLSNPNVAAAAAETIRIKVAASRENPRLIVDISPQDHPGICECENCRSLEEKTGSYGGVLLDFVNRAADLVKPELPDLTVSTLAYWRSRQPPTAAMRTHENVVVRFCSDRGGNFDWPYHSYYDARLKADREWFLRWKEISNDRIHVWLYTRQWRNLQAPMPNLRPVAQNIRFFREHGAESVFLENEPDFERSALRQWVFAKLLWDPSLDVDELMLDFIWGYYGKAAPAVVEYQELLWSHLALYADFDRARQWIYPIHNEEFFRHEFVEKARAILDRAAKAAERDEIRNRVDLLRLGVVYVETAQLYMELRTSDTPPDRAHFDKVWAEFVRLYERLGDKGMEVREQRGGVCFWDADNGRRTHIGDGVGTIKSLEDWSKEIAEAWERQTEGEVQ